MPCKADSQCPSGQVCTDGECVPYGGKPEKERFSFKQAAHRYLKEYKAEERKVTAYSKFIDDQIEEGVEARAEEAEDIGFWGKLGQIAGGIGGCLIGAGAGPAGCVAGATIGSGIMSGVGRTVADYKGHAEDVGLSDTELEALDLEDLKYLKQEFFDIQEEGQRLQENLDDYDGDQWKQHTADVLGDMWQTFNVAKLGTDIFGTPSMPEFPVQPISETSANVAKIEFETALSDFTSKQFQMPSGRDMVPTALDR